jgi:hypothetical protein
LGQSEVFADLVISKETMGTVGGTTAIATHDTNGGFVNSAALTFTGTGDVRATTPSTGYTGFSGGANVFVTNITGRNFQIAGINTTAYTGTFDLSFGAFKDSGTTANSLLLEFSSDGTNYTTIPGTSVTGGSSWRLISLTGITLPTVSNLRLRWSNSAATVMYRLDDITLSGTLAAVPEVSAFFYGGLIAVGFCGWKWRQKRRVEQVLV